MANSIHLTVATVIHRDGHFLMVREKDGERIVINQPAGHVEPGETLQQAALRETLEETGWQVKLSGFLGISHYTAPSNGKSYYRVSFVADVAERVQGAVLDSDILSADWLAQGDIFQSRELRSPLVLADIQRFLNNEIYPLDMIKNIASDV